nr:SulP family inorganic anion transporter [Frankia sp. EI5c]
MRSSAGRAAPLRQLLPGREDVAALRRRPLPNLLAGATVAVVALPLALGFGVSSGAGATAGLVTAIVAGAVAAAFGGSNLQVTGPTGAMTVVLIPIMHEHGLDGVLTVGVLAGLILLGLALLRVGRAMRYLPISVVEGFTAGIAAVIFLQQVPAALGVPAGEHDRVLTTAWTAGGDFLHHPRWTSPALAVGVVAVMLAGARRWPTIPFSLLAVAASTLLVATTGWDVAVIGGLPSTLPAPSLGFLDLATVPSLAGAACAVAALAALESLLSASVADAMTSGERHDPDRELFGQGLANLAAPLFGGVPATGAIARTAVNARTGASSRLAALTHAAILALIMLCAGPLVARVPVAALAGVLLATALRMVEVSSLRALGRASRSDALVLALTAGATVAFDLVIAIVLGLAVAGALALRAVARGARLEEAPLEPVEHLAVYRIEGPLFFAAAHHYLHELTALTDIKVLVLRLCRVSALDGTGALVLRDAVDRLERRGIAVYVSGVRPEHIGTLSAIGILDRLQPGRRLFDSVETAVRAARDQLGARPDATAGRPATPTASTSAPTGAATPDATSMAG